MKIRNANVNEHHFPAFPPTFLVMLRVLSKEFMAIMMSTLGLQESLV